MKTLWYVACIIIGYALAAVATWMLIPGGDW